MQVAHIDPFYFALKNGEVDSRYKYLRLKNQTSAIALSAGETWASSFASGDIGCNFGIIKNAAPLGTISFTGAANTTVTGSGTAFLTDFTAGDYIVIVGSSTLNGRFARIASIASDTSMTTAAAWIAGSSSGLSYQVYSYLMTSAGCAIAVDPPVFVDL